MELNMKTKNKVTTLILLTALSFASAIKADDIVLPIINRPAILEEGTQRTLTPAKIAELLPWAKDSKNFLVDLLDNVQGLTSTDRVDRLIDGIKSVVVESAPKNSELLMRYTLNRALVVAGLLDREINSGSVGFIDAKYRVLTLSIQMALKYYDADMATLTDKKTPSPFADFGKDYFKFLNELNKSIFDASAQYNIQRISLEWLQWDLYRDLNNTSYASQILKVSNALRTFPVSKISDAQSINYVRQMKKISEQLNILEKRQVVVAVVKDTVNTNGTYRYYSYANTPTGRPGGCYQVSSNGAVMWGQGTRSNSNCGSALYKYYNYSNTPNGRSEGCYQLAIGGVIMWEAGTVNNNYCN
jgi:hypothetical protein